MTPVQSKTFPQQDHQSAVAFTGPWRVVFLNDSVNRMSYAVMVLRRIFGFDEDRARQHMLEAHEQGRSIVWCGLRESAEAYAYSLQSWHLRATIEPDEAS